MRLVAFAMEDRKTDSNRIQPCNLQVSGAIRFAVVSQDGQWIYENNSRSDTERARRNVNEPSEISISTQICFSSEVSRNRTRNPINSPGLRFRGTAAQTDKEAVFTNFRAQEAPNASSAYLVLARVDVYDVVFGLIIETETAMVAASSSFQEEIGRAHV